MTDAGTAKTAVRHDWADIPADHPVDHISRQLVVGERMMVGRMIVEEGFDIPPHVPHGVRAIERSVVFDLFSPPSEKTGLDSD